MSEKRQKKQTAVSLYLKEQKIKNPSLKKTEIIKMFYKLSEHQKCDYLNRAESFNNYIENVDKRYKDHPDFTPSVTTRSTIDDYCGETTLTSRSQFKTMDELDASFDLFSQVSTNINVSRPKVRYDKDLAIGSAWAWAWQYWSKLFAAA